MSKSSFYQEEVGVLVQINYNRKSINIMFLSTKEVRGVVIRQAIT